MNRTADQSNHNSILTSLSQEQIRVIAIICSLLSFIVILILYKCIKHFGRRRELVKRNSKKFKNVVLVNNHLAKPPDLKPINQQFQINTAYSSQLNFNRLFPYNNVYSDFKTSESTSNLEPAFYYSDVDDGSEQKNPSFNLENNIYLSKKFIKLNESNKQKAENNLTKSSSINDSNNNSLLSVNNNSINISTDSSRSEESDSDARNKKSQRLSVARPVSIKFNLLYSSKDQCLFIEMLSVDNLIANAKHAYFYVKINLRDHTRESRFKSQKTKLTKGSTSVFFNETKQYSVSQFEKINDCTIQLSVYNRLRSLSRKQLVGDLLVDLSRPDLSENVKLMFDEQLTPICIVSNKKLVSTYKTGELGFLKLELHLINEKVDLHKIKVCVKNAKNLPLKYNSSLDLNKSNAVFVGHPGKLINLKNYFIINFLKFLISLSRLFRILFNFESLLWTREIGR